MILNEGGNAFPDVVPFDHGKIRKIVKQINSVLTQTGAKAITVGSGATPTPGKQSGDLDMMVDQDVLAKKFGAEDAKAARAALEKIFQDAGFQTRKSGTNVHVRSEVDGEAHQVDLMVVPHADMVAKFHTHDIPKGSPYKGKNKQLAMSYLAKQQGLKWSAFKGLVTRDTGELVTRDLDEIAKRLLNPNASAKDLGSVESMMQAIGPERAESMLADLRQDRNWEELETKESSEIARMKQLISY